MIKNDFFRLGGGTVERTLRRNAGTVVVGVILHTKLSTATR